MGLKDEIEKRLTSFRGEQFNCYHNRHAFAADDFSAGRLKTPGKKVE